VSGFHEADVTCDIKLVGTDDLHYMSTVQHKTQIPFHSTVLFSAASSV